MFPPSPDSLGAPFPSTSHRCHHKPKRCLPIQCGNLPISPLLFHPNAKGSLIVMDLAQKTVKRLASFCNAITFSNRPIALYEQVRLKVFPAESNSCKPLCIWGQTRVLQTQMPRSVMLVKTQRTVALLTWQPIYWEYFSSVTDKYFRVCFRIFTCFDINFRLPQKVTPEVDVLRRTHWIPFSSYTSWFESIAFGSLLCRSPKSSAAGAGLSAWASPLKTPPE